MAVEHTSAPHTVYGCVRQHTHTHPIKYTHFHIHHGSRALTHVWSCGDLNIIPVGPSFKASRRMHNLSVAKCIQWDFKYLIPFHLSYFTFRLHHLHLFPALCLCIRWLNYKQVNCAHMNCMLENKNQLSDLENRWPVEFFRILTSFWWLLDVIQQSKRRKIWMRSMAQCVDQHTRRL